MKAFGNRIIFKKIKEDKTDKTFKTREVFIKGVAVSVGNIPHYNKEYLKSIEGKEVWFNEKALIKKIEGDLYITRLDHLELIKY